MNLSKSKYVNSIQCNKMLWLEEYKPEEKEEVKNSSVLDNGTEVGLVAKDLLGPHIDISFNEDLSIMIKDTKKLLEEETIVITEASFLYKNYFCSIDLLKKENNSYEIYEVKSSTEVKDIFLDDISYPVYVLKSLGYNVTKASIVYVNNRYERVGKLNLHELFNIEDVTEIAFEKQSEVLEKLKEIENELTPNEPLIDIGLHCKKPYECPFFSYCTRNLPKNNVFDIRSMQASTKFKMYYKNIITYEDLLKEKINEKSKQQIEFELYDKEPEIDKEKIKEFMSNLYYPLYFLDFETFQQVVPEYDYVKPYMQIPFQYSLHFIKEENEKLEHKEFLGDGINDPRRSLAEQLVKDIPKNSCILAYNMSFEKTVIKNLASIYQDLSEHLMNIYDNIKDLMVPFEKRNYYTKEMHGSYSIKYVLPALFPNEESLNYKNLDLIHNGKEAMTSYAKLSNYTKEEQDSIRTSLLKYCCLDTFAMVKIWEKLKEVINDD